MGSGKFRDFEGKSNSIDCPDFNTNIILPDVTCGHCALGTLSETDFKDVVFNVNGRQQKMTRIDKQKQKPKKSNLTCKSKTMS